MTSVGGEKRHFDCDVNVVVAQRVRTWLGAKTLNHQKCSWPSQYPLQGLPVTLLRCGLPFIRIQLRLSDSSTNISYERINDEVDIQYIMHKAIYVIQ